MARSCSCSHEKARDGYPRSLVPTRGEPGRENTESEPIFIDVMKEAPALILILVALTCCAASSQAASPSLAGSWKVDVAFPNGETRSLHFDARGSGKGSFLPLDPRSSLAETAEPSEAKWTQSDKGSVTFSGPVEFPIGNVGRDRGTLLLKGKFGGEDSITGEAAFFPLGQDSASPKARPSRSGTFKAIRAAAAGPR
jgi:hypothetical protein